MTFQVIYCIIYLLFVCLYFFHIPFHYGLLHDIEYSSLCSTTGPCCLSILYIIVCIPNSHSIPPLPPSHLSTASLFSMSVSLFLFCKYVNLCHILDSTYRWYHMVFVFLWLTSLSMIISRSIYVTANGKDYFILF